MSSSTSAIVNSDAFRELRSLSIVDLYYPGPLRATIVRQTGGGSKPSIARAGVRGEKRCSGGTGFRPGIRPLKSQTKVFANQDRISRTSGKKPDRGHPVRQRAKHALGLAERIFDDVIRVARSGGQDVRNPFPTDQTGVFRSFLKSVPLNPKSFDTQAWLA